MSVTDEEIGQEAGYNVRQETIRLLREKGPKLERVLLRLRQALNAKETKFFAHQGKVEDERDVISHNIRLAATKLALELYDAMPSQKHDVKHSGVIGLKQLLDEIDGSTAGPSGAECQKESKTDDGD